MRARALLLVLALAALAVAPATAEEVELREERVYFHCNGETKVSNLHATLDGAIVGWDTNAPTQSFTQGAGCGTADTTFTGTADHNPLYDAPFAGVFKGELDSLTIHAHSIPVGSNRRSSTFGVNVLLQVNGKTLVNRDLLIREPATVSSTGLSHLLEVTVTDIGLVGEQFRNRNHRVELTLMTYYTDHVNAWVFDATEVDSGITFNPAEATGFVISPDGA
jgi:hypothetical protein